ncbi:MAG: hypothetical protein JNK85_19900 [Verrucomicrobiales bacterium]|nr:hypothetical protein [Verrucomicrobiales bacterium]
MNLPKPPSASARPGESGTILVILLILISLISVITLGASHSLARLRTEVLSLEQRHAARTAANPPGQSAEGPVPREAHEPAH